jgi:hypothetical protein
MHHPHKIEERSNDVPMNQPAESITASSYEVMRCNMNAQRIDCLGVSSVAGSSARAPRRARRRASNREISGKNM